MGWGDAWAGLSQQAMAFAIDSLQSKEQQKYQTKRDEMARKAAEDQERERRKYEERMMNKQAKLNRQMKDSEVAQTFIDPTTGQVVPLTRGQIASGKASVPQFELERQRAEAAMASQGEALKTQKTQADIDAARARAEQARAGAGLSRAKMENPERFLAQRGEDQSDVLAARSMLRTLMEKEKLTAAQAEERVAQMFSEEVAQRAFPGRANRIGQAAQTLQGLSQRAGAYFQQ